VNEVEGLADWLAQVPRGAAAPITGINGAQGSGKSTLAARLAARLRERHGLHAVVLSLDDLYLPRAQREALARQVHPLLRTRGVPGTHDLELGVALLEDLRSGARPRLPKFVKAQDERTPQSGWTAPPQAADLVLFEGWCVGTPPQDDAALVEPVNELEAREDGDGRWRRWVNARLAQDYPRLFGLVDRLVFLQAPDFDSIFRWRRQQELGNAQAGGGMAMDEPALRRFIQHYERLTRQALAVLPRRADVLVELGPAHEWRALLIPAR
jgi:D-glycerate 3-kinase